MDNSTATEILANRHRMLDILNSPAPDWNYGSMTKCAFGRYFGESFGTLGFNSTKADAEFGIPYNAAFQLAFCLNELGGVDCNFNMKSVTQLNSTRGKRFNWCSVVSRFA